MDSLFVLRCVALRRIEVGRRAGSIERRTEREE